MYSGYTHQESWGGPVGLGPLTFERGKRQNSRKQCGAQTCEPPRVIPPSGMVCVR